MPTSQPDEKTLVETRRKEFENALQSLVNHARQEGFVLSIEAISFPPLAMGNYGLQGSAHLAKELYRKPQP